MSILIIDVGTSGVRAGLVEPDGTLHHERYRRLPPATPFPGLVELDAEALAGAALEVAAQVLDGVGYGGVEAVGITNQRASTILWDAADGRSLGPGLGWQDLRTAGDCLALQADGLRLAPNQSATKLAHLLGQPAAAGVPPERLRFGTVDTWLVWHLTGGARHVTDLSNAAVTGLVLPDGSGWDDVVLERLAIPRSVLPAIVDSAGDLGEVTALGVAGRTSRAIRPAPLRLAGLLGDQQASLVGQGGTRPGVAKITFGTGGMLDVFLGDSWAGTARRARPASRTARSRSWCCGTGGVTSWGAEGDPAGRRVERRLAA